MRATREAGAAVLGEKCNDSRTARGNSRQITSLYTRQWGDLVNILRGRAQLRRAWPTPIFGTANTIGAAR